MDDRLKRHGAFSWNELMTTDPGAAKTFYTKLFRWETEEFPMEGMAYTIVNVGGEGVGGITTIPPQAEGAPPHWSTIVTVDDVDETVNLAEELGGKILQPPMDIPDVGRLSVIQDPQGAVITVITYSGD